ncbi:MAG: hypothetical protein ACI9DH_000480 [Halioglobus sp.]|jgi:hypothetical protein
MDYLSDWFHGTSSKFSQWKIESRHANLKNGMPLHGGLFFTKSLLFAKQSVEAYATNGHVYKTSVLPGIVMLDLSCPGETCTTAESESFRKVVRNVRPGKGNAQVDYQHYWQEGWKTGEMMKFAPPPHEAAYYQNLHHIALREPDTIQGVAIKNHLQAITRDCIEDIVTAGKLAGYQAIVGNEFQSGVSYPILIVLDSTILTSPVLV